MSVTKDYEVITFSNIAVAGAARCALTCYRDHIRKMLTIDTSVQGQEFWTERLDLIEVAIVDARP